MLSIPPPCKVAASVCHSIVISTEVENDPVHGSAYAFGKDSNNVFGAGKTSAGSLERLVPYRLDNWRNNVYEVSCGDNHTAFIEKGIKERDGQLCTCGLGNRGRLGYRNPSHGQDARVEVEDMWTMQTPKRVSFPNSIGILRVSCGGDHTLVLDTLCRVWAFGMNSEGQCGQGHARDVREPTLVQDLVEPVTHISGGGFHSLCVMNGKVEQILSKIICGHRFWENVTHALD